MHVISDAVRQAAPWLERYGYFAIFGAVFIEAVGVPAPGVILMIAAAMAAARGEMALPLVFLAAIAASLLGSNCSYWLGALGGQNLLRRIPFFNLRRYEKLCRLFERWGAVVVIVAPLLDGLRQLNGYAAGIADMSWYRFAWANLAGSLLYTVLWLGLGYEVGIHARALYIAIGGGRLWWYVAACALLVVGLSYLFWYERRKGRKARGTEEEG